MEPVLELLTERTWLNRKVLVTTGPTREPIDAVRFIGNRSSGRMGNAIARQAKLRGAEVTLIRGRGVIDEPIGNLDSVEVETAREMSDAVKERFDECDLLVMAAAVADWTVKNPSPTKLKKRDGAPAINLEKTEDILTWACQKRKHQVVVGFALETENHLREARGKLEKKGADVIVLNDATQADSAFGGDTTKLTLLSKDNRVEELPIMPKLAAAGKMLDFIESYLKR